MDCIFEPTKPFVLINYLDVLFLIGIFVFDFLVFRGKIIIESIVVLKVIMFILVFFILPVVSMKFEIDNVNNKYGMVDAMNVLYTYFKIPVWWAIGVIEIIVLGRIIKIKERTEFSELR